ncbi:F-box associated interaction domain [Arabidopsis suecica]|uniref:F-box associated interaction domain n=1 Tax=Arabidopsis suecica TaxID=45249 RepID=A0A8T2B8L8_ARASU|nr:F-box associated interaction domain [Arabidopsis suecica]
MMMSDLPADLVEEILSRVPATSLKRLRSTCKQWNALFKNRGFAKKHIRKAPKQSLVLLWKYYRVCSISVNLNVAPSIEFKGALSIKDFRYNSKQVKIARVFHCDGLLLCTAKDDRLVVWNPCLGENRWIPLRTDYKKDTTFSLGYQNNKSCRSYKILKWWNCYEPNHHVVGLEIYEFSSDSWRVLDKVDLDFYLQTNSCVSLKGNTYWLTSDLSEKFFHSFDFTRERFKRLCLPPNPKSCYTVLSVVREEQLSVLHQNFDTSEIDIWMTSRTDSEADLLWRKSFTMDLKICSPYSYPICMSYLILEEKKVAAFCAVRKCSYEAMHYIITIIGEDDEYHIEIPHEDPTYWSGSFIFNYTPSLVQIKREHGNHYWKG